MFCGTPYIQILLLRFFSMDTWLDQKLDQPRKLKSAALRRLRYFIDRPMIIWTWSCKLCLTWMVLETTSSMKIITTRSRESPETSASSWSHVSENWSANYGTRRTSKLTCLLMKCSRWAQKYLFIFFLTFRLGGCSVFQEEIPDHRAGRCGRVSTLASQLPPSSARWHQKEVLLGYLQELHGIHENTL